MRAAASIWSGVDVEGARALDRAHPKSPNATGRRARMAAHTAACSGPSSHHNAPMVIPTAAEPNAATTQGHLGTSLSQPWWVRGGRAPRQPVLQARVSELIEGADLAQEAQPVGVVQEAHQAPGEPAPKG